MTFADKETLAEVELVDPAHYFGVVEAPVGPMGAQVTEPVYGLADARFPDATEPVDADNARIVAGVVAEDVSSLEDYGAQPVLTLLLKQEAPDDETPEAEAAILLNEPPTESDINPVVDNPAHAGAIIRGAIKHLGLERVRTTPNEVAGVEERHLNAASFLIEAGMRRIDDNVFELTADDNVPAPSDKEAVTTDQELLAAA